MRRGQSLHNPQSLARSSDGLHRDTFSRPCQTLVSELPGSQRGYGRRLWPMDIPCFAKHLGRLILTGTELGKGLAHTP